MKKCQGHFAWSHLLSLSPLIFEMDSIISSRTACPPLNKIQIWWRIRVISQSLMFKLSQRSTEGKLVGKPIAPFNWVTVRMTMGLGCAWVVLACEAWTLRKWEMGFWKKEEIIYFWQFTAFIKLLGVEYRKLVFNISCFKDHNHSCSRAELSYFSIFVKTD